ncbi:MAG: hypothetical protein JO318_15575 [Chloroflexi bacterium]|nr:hypothetical protein [Chloroflexota bacterium]
MHPVTRLGRVIQQLRSFADLHASELESMALDLEASGATDLGARLRAYRDVQRDEATMVVQELTDIRDDMAANSRPEETPSTPTEGGDPAVNSPKRAKWLAEQAAEAERLRQPVSRRDLFGRIANAGDDEPDSNALPG